MQWHWDVETASWVVVSILVYGVYAILSSLNAINKNLIRCMQYLAHLSEGKGGQ